MGSLFLCFIRCFLSSANLRALSPPDRFALKKVPGVIFCSIIRIVALGVPTLPLGRRFRLIVMYYLRKEISS